MSDAHDDLSELYQELLLDHSRQPHNRRAMPDATRRAEGFNPMCGDHVMVYLAMDGDRVRDVSFDGQACAICTASASMMTDAVRSQSREHVLHWFDRFHDLLTGSADAAAGDELPEEINALAGVRRFPMRVKCATLPWHTLRAAIMGEGDAVSTE